METNASGSLLTAASDASFARWPDSEPFLRRARFGSSGINSSSALKGGGTVTLGDSPLFPGVAYAVKEGARLGLGDEGNEVSVEQVDGGAGTAGVDMMSKMMQMQFEATLKPEIKKALEIKRRE